MKLKPKRKRLVFVTVGAAILGVAVLLVLNAFRENIVFFLSPTELLEKGAPSDRVVRLGGLVEDGSVTRGPDSSVRFKVTDLKHDIPVRYVGILPDLFREGQGVVAEGRLQPDGSFQASSVLAKHDEKYMPPEVAEALKKSGRWQEGPKP
ncbi:MAG TPA: cytochrome c maturation protein CcmE [Alphaproteobacteria bacterium]|nr:cytochrome c maturation protein CcmE [Alphaproteobacteria bacterium]